MLGTRYALLGSLFLEPLGTIVSMRLMADPVKGNR